MQKGTCKFYNGDYHNTHCEAGVCYKSVTTDPENTLGVAFRKPCVNWDKVHVGSPMTKMQIEQWEKRGTCSKYQEPTNQEIQAYEAEMTAHMNKFLLLTPVIKKVKRENFGKAWSGTVECPVCKGKLWMTHSSYNGHVHGKCETKGCVAWME